MLKKEAEWIKIPPSLQVFNRWGHIAYTPLSDVMRNSSLWHRK